MNSRKEIEAKNEVLFKEYLKMNKKEYFNKLKQIGEPKGGFGGDKWSDENPTAGRCASVVGALRLSGKIPKDYVACGQNDQYGSHYYLVNPDTLEVIDPTCYQMKNEYDYDKYHQQFFPQVSKNVLDTMNILGLEIDETKFKTKKDSRGTLIVSKMK